MTYAQKHRPLRILAIFLAFGWTIVPSVARSRAADSTSQETVSQALPSVTPLNVRITKTNQLQGTVMNPGGVPAAKQVVVLGKLGKPIARTQTNNEGVFTFDKIVPGEYQLATNDAIELVNCVAHEATVTDAVPSVLMGKEAMVTRGALNDTLFHPLFVGLVVAAAIAIPFAIAGNDEDDAS